MKQHRFLLPGLLVAAALLVAVAGFSTPQRETKGPLIQLQADGSITETTGCLDDFVGKGILRNSAKYFLLWGALLTAVSLIVYLLWNLTGKPQWNFLWFAMPVIGYPLAALMGKYDVAVPQNEVSKMLTGVWRVFGVFAITLSVVAICLVPMNVSLIIVIILGLAECMSGVLLKNWPIIVCGFLLGVCGAVVAFIAEDEHISPLDALTKFYASDTYRRLEREETKLWHYGPVALYQDYCLA